MLRLMHKLNLAALEKLENNAQEISELKGIKTSYEEMGEQLKTRPSLKAKNDEILLGLDQSIRQLE